MILLLLLFIGSISTYSQVSDVLDSVNTKLADSLHTSNDMLESIASSISKAGYENKEVLGEIGSKIENGQTKIATAIDSASDMIDHVKEEIKTSGEMMESGLGTVGTKLGVLDVIATNLKNFETSSKEGLSMIVTDIEDLTKALISNLIC